MADRVRFILDGLAPLFKLLQIKDIFNENEIHEIVKKTSDHEYTLRRRVLTELDYHNYITYYNNFYKLLTIRCEKEMKKDESISKDVKIIYNYTKNHISYIYERSVRRFPRYLSFWYGYIDHLVIIQNKSLLNSLYGRLLSIHSNNELVWIKAANFELFTNGNSESTRILLQRSLRFNPKSQKLWMFYYKFELWYASRILDRKQVLGLQVDSLDIISIPYVIFTHAIEEIKDIEFGLNFYKLSLNISSILSNQIKEKLYDQYPNHVDLWLCDITTLLDFEFQKPESEIENSSNPESKIQNNENKIKLLIEELQQIFDNFHKSIDIYSNSNDILNENEHIELSIKFIDLICKKLLTCLYKYVIYDQTIDSIIRLIFKLLDVISNIYKTYSTTNKYVQLVSLQAEFRLGLVVKYLTTNQENNINTERFKYQSISLIDYNFKWFPLTSNEISDNLKNILTPTNTKNLQSVIHLTALVKDISNYLLIDNSISNNQAVISIYLIYTNLYKDVIKYRDSSDYLLYIINYLSITSTIHHKDIDQLYLNILSLDNYKDFDCNSYYIKYIEFSMLYINDKVTETSFDTIMMTQRDKVRSVYMFINKLLNNKPNVLIYIDLTTIYLKLLDIEDYYLTIYPSNDINRYKHHLLILQEATKQCPGTESFWDKYIFIERELGNHKKANHLRWLMTNK